jgi:hypothetical protein
MEWVPIMPEVVSSNPAHGEMYTVQYNVIKLVSDKQLGGFFGYSSFRHHDITEILLKVAINTTKLTAID